MYKNEPTSRSYFTSQLLKNRNLSINKSDEVDQLVEDLKKETANNIICIWEHSVIPKIIHKLIGVSAPDYDHTVSNISKQLGKEIPLKSTQAINEDDIKNIQLCAKDFKKDNEKVNDHITTLKDDVAYSLVWDINFTKKSYTVYSGYLIESNKTNWQVLKYL